MLQDLAKGWDSSYKLMVGAVVALTIVGGTAEGVQRVKQYQHDHHVSQGTVIGKEYDDPDTWTQMVCSGKPMHCTPIVHHDGEHWRLHLQGTDRVGEQHELWHDVDKGTFKQAQKGQQYDIDQESWIDR
jgi:hypothetical protein